MKRPQAVEIQTIQIHPLANDTQRMEENPPLMEPIPKFLSIDENECIPPRRRVGDWPLNNFVRNAHWKIILIGETTACFFT